MSIGLRRTIKCEVVSKKISAKVGEDGHVDRVEGHLSVRVSKDRHVINLTHDDLGQVVAKTPKFCFSNQCSASNANPRHLFS